MQCIDTSVVLMRQTTYEQADLDGCIGRLLDHTPIPRGNLCNTRVLLKPNLITATNGELACTDGRFIGAVARWFLDRGARVAVGDSPSFGTARSVLTALGALRELQRLGVPVVEFRQRRQVLLPGGHRAAIAAAALDCDLLVNLPKVKAHSQMRLTLSVKNYFGCVAGLHKPWWHMVHGGSQGPFARLLVELLNVLPTGCSLVDGIVAMHRTGPVHGNAYPLGIVAAGINPVAVDTALQTLLGIDPLGCPLWRAAHGASIVGTAMAELVFPLRHPTELRAEGFLVPEELGPVRFSLLRFVKSSLQRLVLRLRARKDGEYSLDK
jgi:uncharacterized protein (DUF362 family)